MNLSVSSFAFKNTNGIVSQHTCDIRMLSLIFKNKSPYDLSEQSNMKETIEALLPYTERRLKRINRLLQQSEFLQYTWQRMKLTEPAEQTHSQVSVFEETATTATTSNDHIHSDDHTHSSDHTRVKEQNPDPSATPNGHAHNESCQDMENNIDENENALEIAENEDVSPPREQEPQEITKLETKEKSRLKRKLKTMDEDKTTTSKFTQMKEGKENTAKKKLKGKKKLRTAS